MYIKQVKICFSIQDLWAVLLLAFLRSATWEYVADFQFQIYCKDNLTEWTAKWTMWILV